MSYRRAESLDSRSLMKPEKSSQPFWSGRISLIVVAPPRPIGQIPALPCDTYLTNIYRLNPKPAKKSQLSYWIFGPNMKLNFYHTYCSLNRIYLQKNSI